MSTSEDMINAIKTLVEANGTDAVKDAMGNNGDAWADDAAMKYVVQGIAETVDAIIAGYHP